MLENSWSGILKRVILEGLLGIGLLLLAVVVVNPKLIHEFNDYSIAALTFILQSEGNILIHFLLNRKIPWFYRPQRRILIQLIFSFLFMSLIIVLVLWIRLDEVLLSPDHLKVFILGILFAVTFVLMFNSVLFGIAFFKEYKHTFSENEKLRREKLELDYRVLQNQLNPHFLFNSLNSLISEINYNPEKAVAFAQKLSDIYRYILNSRNFQLVSLQTELSFLKSYVYLHQVRHGENFKVEFDISDDFLDYELPPLTLQLLIENVIKHNKISEKNPLDVRVRTESDGYLVVSNTLQEKKNVISSGLGLENIKARYLLLTDRSVENTKTEDLFLVKIPLLGE